VLTQQLHLLALLLVLLVLLVTEGLLGVLHWCTRVMIC
jgi:hypothetical protein